MANSDNPPSLRCNNHTVMASRRTIVAFRYPRRMYNIEEARELVLCDEKELKGCYEKIYWVLLTFEKMYILAKFGQGRRVTRGPVPRGLRTSERSLMQQCHITLTSTRLPVKSFTIIKHRDEKKKYLTTEATFVTFQLDYCNALLVMVSQRCLLTNS